mgnify:CR=1 FL=1
MTRVQPAQLPPSGLPGLDPAWSRLVDAESGDGSTRTWHVLDTHATRQDEPDMTLLCVHGNPTWSYLWRTLLLVGTAADRQRQHRHDKNLTHAIPTPFQCRALTLDDSIPAQWLGVVEREECVTARRFNNTTSSAPKTINDTTPATCADSPVSTA